MTATLPVASVSLVERARAAFAESEAERAEIDAARLKVFDDTQREKLRELLASRLGVAVPLEHITVHLRGTDDAEITVAQAVVDGLRFEVGERGVLSLVQSCPECHDRQVTTWVDTLEQLGAVLSDTTPVPCDSCYVDALPPLETKRVTAPAEAAIAAIAPAADALGEALVHEQHLEDRRCFVKSASIIRIMAMLNPETGKQHTASSAEKVVETDAEYLAYRGTQSAAVVARIQAEARYESAKLRASLAQTSF